MPFVKWKKNNAGREVGATEKLTEQMAKLWSEKGWCESCDDPTPEPKKPEPKPKKDETPKPAETETKDIPKPPQHRALRRGSTK